SRCNPSPSPQWVGALLLKFEAPLPCGADTVSQLQIWPATGNLGTICRRLAKGHLQLPCHCYLWCNLLRGNGCMQLHH
ncbi:Os11g0180300, partial [Oryza sativa Japonica Group]